MADRPGAEGLASRLGVLDGPVEPRPKFAERLFAELTGVSPVIRFEGSVHPLEPIVPPPAPDADTAPTLDADLPTVGGGVAPKRKVGFPSPLGGGVAPEADAGFPSPVGGGVAAKRKVGFPYPLGGGVAAKRTGWGVMNKRWLPFAAGLVAVGLLAGLFALVRPAEEHRTANPTSSTIGDDSAGGPVPVEIPDAVERRPVPARLLSSPDWQADGREPVLPRTIESKQLWTGDELVVFDSLSRAAAYRPDTNTWRVLPAAPIDAGIGEVTLLWAGDELLAWSDDEAAAWAPATNTWRQVGDWPFRSEGDDRFIWTGSEVVGIDGDLAVDPGTGETRSAPSGGSGEGDDYVVTDGGAVFDVAEGAWVLVPPNGLSPNANDAVWTGTEVFAADYEMQAVGYQPGAESWSPYPFIPLRFSECAPSVHVVDGRALVEHCAGAALWDPDMEGWLPIALPELFSDVRLVSTGDQVYAVGRGAVYRLGDGVLADGPHRLAVGSSMLDVPAGWAVASTTAEVGAGPDEQSVISIDLIGPDGAACTVRAINGEAAEVIRPFLVPGHQVTTLDFLVGGKPSEVVAVPHDGHEGDGRHHYVWATGTTDVVDVGCADGRDTPTIARNVWSPWEPTG